MADPPSPPIGVFSRRLLLLHGFVQWPNVFSRTVMNDRTCAWRAGGRAEDGQPATMSTKFGVCLATQLNFIAPSTRRLCLGGVDTKYPSTQYICMHADIQSAWRYYLAVCALR